LKPKIKIRPGYDKSFWEVSCLPQGYICIFLISHLSSDDTEQTSPVSDFAEEAPQSSTAVLDDANRFILPPIVISHDMFLNALRVHRDGRGIAKPAIGGPFCDYPG
jgi:hypothetical protein